MLKGLLILGFKFLGVLFIIIYPSHQALAVGDAGCGLGSVIFSRNTIISQVSAATTNGTSTNQTSGMTSGTSNCKAHGLVMAEKEQIYMAESNFNNLRTEMAQGSGENLIAFSQVLGCSVNSREMFNKLLKSNYESIFPSKEVTPIKMLDSIKTTIKMHPALARDCLYLS